MLLWRWKTGKVFSMEEDRHGYSMPLGADKRETILVAFLLPIFLAAWAFVTYCDMRYENWSESAIRGMMTLFAVFFIYSYFYGLYQCFAKLHFVPEGVAITIFGFTVRMIPAERICLLAGIICTEGKRNHRLRIAVCDCSLEELADIGERKTPKMLRNLRTMKGWTEDMAGKYLHKRGSSAFRDLDRSCRILWLEWDKERLELLREFYPSARWIDLTEKKVFDEQLEQR